MAQRLYRVQQYGQYGELHYRPLLPAPMLAVDPGGLLVVEKCDWDFPWQ